MQLSKLELTFESLYFFIYQHVYVELSCGRAEAGREQSLGLLRTDCGLAVLAVLRRLGAGRRRDDVE
eukprot:4475962-Prymnesium_polylepis.1